MFPIELKALRRNLGLTQAEAGQALAANVDFPHGASAEEWAQWENGTAPIPLHVVRAVETRLNQNTKPSTNMPNNSKPKCRAAMR